MLCLLSFFVWVHWWDDFSSWCLSSCSRCLNTFSATVSTPIEHVRLLWSSILLEWTSVICVSQEILKSHVNSIICWIYNCDSFLFPYVGSLSLALFFYYLLGWRLSNLIALKRPHFDFSDFPIVFLFLKLGIFFNLFYLLYVTFLFSVQFLKVEADAIKLTTFFSGNTTSITEFLWNTD